MFDQCVTWWKKAKDLVADSTVDDNHMTTWVETTLGFYLQGPKDKQLRIIEEHLKKTCGPAFASYLMTSTRLPYDMWRLVSQVSELKFNPSIYRRAKAENNVAVLTQQVDLFLNDTERIKTEYDIQTIDNVLVIVPNVRTKSQLLAAIKLASSFSTTKDLIGQMTESQYNSLRPLFRYATVVRSIFLEINTALKEFNPNNNGWILQQCLKMRPDIWPERLLYLRDVIILEIESIEHGHFLTSSILDILVFKELALIEPLFIFLLMSTSIRGRHTDILFAIDLLDILVLTWDEVKRAK